MASGLRGRTVWNNKNVCVNKKRGIHRVNCCQDYNIIPPIRTAVVLRLEYDGHFASIYYIDPCAYLRMEVLWGGGGGVVLAQRENARYIV